MNSAGPDENAFYLDLHCLHNPYKGVSVYKGLSTYWNALIT